MGELVPLQAPVVDVQQRAPARARAQLLAAGYLAGYSGRTREAYAADLLQWGTWCAGHDLEVLDVGRAHVQLWVRELEQLGRAASTVSRKLSAVGGFYAYAVVEGDIAKSPVVHVRRPRVSDESPRFGLDRDELGRLLAVALEHSPTAYALVCLLALNGLRVTEACAARPADLSADRGHQLLAVLRKGGKRARVPLAPRTAAAIAALRPPAGATLLEVDRFGAWRLVRRLVDAAGITKTISPHSLRHTFVTLALDARVELRDVQDAAGHADPRTTRRYDRGRDSLERHATYAVAAYVDVDPAQAA